MTETIKKIFEDLTKNCTQEDKAKILQFVEPGESGKDKKSILEYTPEELEQIRAIIEGMTAALDEEAERLAQILRTRYEEEPARGEDLKKAAAKEEAQKSMNGYSIFAESYRKLANEGKISQEEAEKTARNYDYLASCDQEDIFNLFDSSAFNEIAKSYLRIAIKELIEEGKIEEEQGRAVRNRFNMLFSEKKAKEAWEI